MKDEDVEVLERTPFYGHPVGHLMPQMAFADDPNNPVKILEPYVGRAASAIEQLLGIPLLPLRAARAARELGYDADDAFLFFADGTGHKVTDDAGRQYVPDMEALFDGTNEVWAAFWNRNGNNVEAGAHGLEDRDVTVVRII